LGFAAWPLPTRSIFFESEIMTINDIGAVVCVFVAGGLVISWATYMWRQK
jgi:hypothetical protein